MSHPLSLSRAAHLVGVPRATLQRMVRGGEIACADGLIDTDELRRVFPDARFEDSGALERVTSIRDSAFGRRLREHVLPSQEVLARRLYEQSRELAELRRHLQAYHRLVERTLDVLADDGAQERRAARARIELEQGLAQVLASEPPDAFEAMSDLMRIVSANVVVRPSGNEFLVTGNDSVLQAGLKAGLGLNYGCNGGNCGLCKARIVSGEVRRIANSDYPMSAAEQRQGYVLLCTCTALTDLVVETLEASGPRDIPEQSIVARLRRVEPLARDTVLLHLQTPRTDRLRFLAGQSVTLGLADPEGDLSATFALASCPCDDRNLLFHVVRDPGSAFAMRLFEAPPPAGASVTVRGPSGEFVLGQGQARPLLMLACDHGFAPVKSLIEHAMAAEAAETICLCWAATRPDGHYLERQCAAWADALDEFLFVPTKAADPLGAADALLASLPAAISPSGSEAFIAGPAAFVEAVAAGVAALGVPTERIRCCVV